MSEARGGGDVDDLPVGVGNGFDPEHPRRALHLAGEGARVGGIEERQFYPSVLGHVAQPCLPAVIHHARGDHAVPGA